MNVMKKYIEKQEKDIESDYVPLDPAAREAQMISLATDLAYQQLKNGTASSQVITHYLKLGTQREKIEKEILEKQKELIEEKTNAIKQTKNVAELYENAIAAMKRYSGYLEDDNK